jgi:hypothetical protein
MERAGEKYLPDAVFPQYFNESRDVICVRMREYDQIYSALKEGQLLSKPGKYTRIRTSVYEDRVTCNCPDQNRIPLTYVQKIHMELSVWLEVCESSKSRYIRKRKYCKKIKKATGE